MLLESTLAAGLAALAGCYSPEVRDCTVSCASLRDCVRGQICGKDGLCAAPEVAGRCASALTDGGSSHDAGASRDARSPSDATVSLDAPSTVSLHVQITGKGSVVVIGRGTCSSQDPQRGDCNYDIVVGAPQTVSAVDIQPKASFSMWTSVTCTGQGATCTFIPTAATIVVASFDHRGSAL